MPPSDDNLSLSVKEEHPLFSSSMNNTLKLWLQHAIRRSSNTALSSRRTRHGLVFCSYPEEKILRPTVPRLPTFRMMSSEDAGTTETQDLRKRKADNADGDEVDNDSEKQRQEQVNDDSKEDAASNDSWFGDGLKKKKKKSKKEVKNNHTRQKDGERVEKEPHAGSFANEEQRKLFNVELPPEEDPEIAKTRSKRKVAFLLGYLGTNYTGFQINEKQRTLQGDFELALLRCNFLMRSNFGYPPKYGW